MTASRNAKMQLSFCTTALLITIYTRIQADPIPTTKNVAKIVTRV